MTNKAQSPADKKVTDYNGFWGAIEIWSIIVPEGHPKIASPQIPL